MEKAPSRPSPGTACVTVHVYGVNGKETLVLYGVISFQHLRAAAPALPPTQTSSAGAGSPCGLSWCCPSVCKCPSSPLLTHLSCKTLPGSHAAFVLPHIPVCLPGRRALCREVCRGPGWRGGCQWSGDWGGGHQGQPWGLLCCSLCPSGKGRGLQEGSRGLLARLLEATVKRSPAR